MAKRQAGSAGDERSIPGEVKGQVSVITLKGSEAYRDWLVGFSKTTHIPAASLVRLGLIELAKKHGIEAPPEK